MLINARICQSCNIRNDAVAISLWDCIGLVWYCEAACRPNGIVKSGGDKLLVPVYLVKVIFDVGVILTNLYIAVLSFGFLFF